MLKNPVLYEIGDATPFLLIPETVIVKTSSASKVTGVLNDTALVENT
jgi:selenocysteine lyase/cysteine desulfurase